MYIFQIEYAATDAMVGVDIFVCLVLAKITGVNPRQNRAVASQVTMDQFLTTARSLVQGLVDSFVKQAMDSSVKVSMCG
jgi:hypothetical protein